MLSHEAPKSLATWLLGLGIAVLLFILYGYDFVKELLRSLFH
jgi:hypothetical protein